MCRKMVIGMRAFDDMETAALGRAYQRAVQALACEAALEGAALEEAKTCLASRLLALAEAGEHDEWRLSRAALLYLRGEQWRHAKSPALLKGSAHRHSPR